MTETGESEPRPGQGRRVNLRILATSDLHAAVHPYDYFADTELACGGLGSAATLIEALRTEADNCLLFDNGDTLQGTPLGDYAAGPGANSGRTHPVVAAMNAVGYDAMTLGNHDFNYGLEFLERTLEPAEFPIVLSNVRRADGREFRPPWVILRRRVTDSAGRPVTLKIGVAGFVPPQIMNWDRMHLRGRLEAEDILLAARRELPLLRAAGADVVLVLCHSGIADADPRPGMENAVVPLAATAGADAIVAGHTHHVFPGAPDAANMPRGVDAERGTVGGIPVVQPGAGGSHLGVIDLELEHGTDGWRVARSQSRAEPVRRHVTAPAAAPNVLRVTARDHDATLEFVRRQIGRTAAPIQSYFALLENSPAVQIVADAQRAHAQRLLEGHPLAGLPLLSAAAPFKCGGRAGPAHYVDIPAGPLAVRNAADLYPFPNAFCVLRVTGRHLLDWLERSACAFHRIEAGRPGQLLIDHAFASYNFDVIDGLRYRIDVTAPARFSADGESEFETGGRVRDVTADGRPLDPEAEFLVATNSYRAAGGGHFRAARDAEIILSDRRAVREIVADHMTAASTLAPRANPTWRFAGAGGTEVIAETGPGALVHRKASAELGLRHVGRSPEGFARFSFRL